MKKNKLRWFWMLVISALFFCTAFELKGKARESVEEEKELTLYARSAVLMDADSGRVLYEKDGNAHMPNASTTKILTCILAIESGCMEETAQVSVYAAAMPKVHLGMQAGDTFKIKDLLYSLMLESHNDSAVVIAEHIGGSVEDFAELMNQKAAEIGCADTYFITSNGLDAQDARGIHGTTAEDLAKIMSYCIKNETFLEITRTPSYSFSNLTGTKTYQCQNHNAFLSMMDGALSGKTGFTGNAGYCYVGALRQGDRTFVVSLLACGWPNHKAYKWADTKTLMQYGLDNFFYEEIMQKEDGSIHSEHSQLLQETAGMKEIPVENACPKAWRLYQKSYITPQTEAMHLKVLKKAAEELRVEYELPEKLQAPVEVGEKIGRVRFYLDDSCIGEAPIYSGEKAEKITQMWYAEYVMRNFFMLPQTEK